MIYFSRVDGALVEGNAQPLLSGSLVGQSNSTGIVVR
jgi:hypothetical protein